jgi:hypothetical protein
MFNGIGIIEQTVIYSSTVNQLDSKIYQGLINLMIVETDHDT